MANQDLGRVAMIPRGAYDPAAEYERLDVVSYQGSSYLVLASCTGVTPEEGPYYMLTAAQGRNAYQYAVDQGYTGTEEEFARKLTEPIPAVDTTLSQSGQAAEAAAVQEALDALSEDIGGRVKTVNGIAPDESCNVALPSEWDRETISWDNSGEVTTGQFVNQADNETGYTITTHSNYAYAVAKVKEGCYYRVTCDSPKGPGFVAMFRDASGVKIGVVEHTQSGEINLYEELVIDVPQGAYDIVVNSFVGSSAAYPSVTPVIGEGVPVSPKIEVAGLRDETEQLSYENAQLARRALKAEKGNDFAWGTFDKAYFVFVHDDTNSFLPTAYSAFHAENVPLSAATIVGRLSNTYEGKTAKEWLDLLVADGGEVLTHYDADLLNTSEDALWRTHVVEPKQTLEQAGYSVRGLILANNSDARSEKGEAFCRRYYDYADKVGIAPQYSMGRELMLKYGDLEAFKAHIDDCAATPGLYAFGFHGLRSDEEWITQDSLQEIIQYISSKDGTEISTYAAVFDRIGTTALAGQTGGKSAYQYAVEGGYTGTEAEFAKKLAAETSGEGAYVLLDTIEITQEGVTAFQSEGWEMDKLACFLYSPANDTAFSWAFSIYQGSTQSGFAWLGNMTNTDNRYASVYARREQGMAFTENTAPSANEKQNAALYRSPGYVSGDAPFTKVDAYTAGSNPFPVGTKIEIWGVAVNV